MRSLAKLSERELDGILAGKSNGGELDDVASFIREMRLGLNEALPARVQESHLASIVAEARRVARSTPERSVQTPRSTPRLRNPFRRLAARATITTVSLTTLTAFGGAAYAGALPDRLQGPVAEIAHKVGISLPRTHNHPKRHHPLHDSAQHADNPNQNTPTRPVHHTSTNTRANTTKPTGHAESNPESKLQANDETTHTSRHHRRPTDTNNENKHRQSNGGANNSPNAHDSQDKPSQTSGGQDESVHGGAHDNGDQTSAPADAQATQNEPAVQPTAQNEQTAQPIQSENRTPTNDSTASHDQSSNTTSNPADGGN